MPEIAAPNSNTDRDGTVQTPRRSHPVQASYCYQASKFDPSESKSNNELYQNSEILTHVARPWAAMVESQTRVKSNTWVGETDSPQW
jgi:hypothetical protein